MTPGRTMQRWIDRTYQEIYSAIELQEIASRKGERNVGFGQVSVSATAVTNHFGDLSRLSI